VLEWVKANNYYTIEKIIHLLEQHQYKTDNEKYLQLSKL